MGRALPSLALALLGFAVCAAAAGPAGLKPQGYVSDFARVLDPRARAELESYCGRVEQATGAQIALVTVASLDGEPVESYAVELFRRWGIGSKQNNEGILVLLAIRDRRSRVEVGYGLEPVIPDGFAGGVLRSMREALRAGDYASALSEAAQTIGAAIAREKNVEIGGAPLPRRRPAAREDDGQWHPLLVALGVLAFLWLTGGRGGRGGRGGSPMNLLLAMMAGEAIGRGGRRGGGGFGGYDSWGGGGGFGGFGGGMSGGGGASGSW